MVADFAKLGRKRLVCGGGIGPYGIPAMGWHHQCSKNRHLRIGIYKSDVGVPRDSAVPVGTIDVEHRFGSIHGRNGWMGHDIPQKSSKSLVARLIQMRLAAEEDYLVLEKGAPNLLNGRWF